MFGTVFGVSMLESIKELLEIKSQIPKWNMKKQTNDNSCRLLGTTRPNFQCIFQAKVYPALGMKIVNLKECIAHANCMVFTCFKLFIHSLKYGTVGNSKFEGLQSKFHKISKTVVLHKSFVLLCIQIFCLYFTT